MADTVSKVLLRYLEHGAGSRGITPLVSQLVAGILQQQAMPDLHHNTASLRSACTFLMHACNPPRQQKRPCTLLLDGPMHERHQQALFTRYVC